MTYRGKVFSGIALVVASLLAWILFSGSTPQKEEVLDRATVLENSRKTLITQKRKEIDQLLQEGVQQSEKLFDLIRSMYAVEVFTAVQIAQIHDVQNPILGVMDLIKTKVARVEEIMALLVQEKNTLKIAELLSNGMGQIDALSRIPEAACLVDIKNLQQRLLITTAVSLSAS